MENELILSGKETLSTTSVSIIRTINENNLEV